MKQNKTALVFILLLLATLAISWGPTGHRTAAEIAANHLNRKAKKNIKKILDGASLAEVSTFADEIKSDKRYPAFSPWHYVNYPKGGTYATAPKNPKGDIITGIDSCITVLKDKNSSKDDKAFYLKLLVHLVGDFHQPLHIGHKKDRGGNDIQVQWHGVETNIHHVWDEDLINKWDMSYTELAKNIDTKLSKKEIEVIQQGSLIDWMKETRIITDQVYAGIKPGYKLSYRYSYKHMNTVKKQLHKGGLRLAKILNEIW